MSLLNYFRSPYKFVFSCLSLIAVVTVKPTFKDGDETSRSLASPAGRTVKLSCRATGYPEPRVNFFLFLRKLLLPTWGNGKDVAGGVAQERRDNYGSESSNDGSRLQNPQRNAGDGGCSRERFWKVHVRGTRIWTIDADAAVIYANCLNPGVQFSWNNSKDVQCHDHQSHAWTTHYRA